MKDTNTIEKGYIGFNITPGNTNKLNIKNNLILLKSEKDKYKYNTILFEYTENVLFIYYKYTDIIRHIIYSDNRINTKINNFIELKWDIDDCIELSINCNSIVKKELKREIR